MPHKPEFDEALKVFSSQVPHDCDDPDCPGRNIKRKLDAFDGLVKALEELTATGFNSKGEYEDWMFGARARGRVALAKALGKGE